MDYMDKDWEALIERFWNGDASLEEEHELKMRCKYEEVPEKWQDLAAYFETIDDEQEELLLGSDFDGKILGMLEDEAPSKVFSLRKWVLPIAAAAAILCIVFMMPGSTPESAAQQPTKQEVQNAYKQTQEALFLISSKMNRGKSHARSLKKFNKAKRRLKNKK